MIRSIQIKNFRSLRDVSVDFGPLTVLIGRGGTGKTNFVNAIAFFRDSLLRKDAAIAEWQQSGKLFCATAPRGDNKTKSEIVFVVKFDVPGHDGHFEYTLCLALGSPQTHTAEQFTIARETLTRDQTVLFSRDGNNWLKQPAVAPLPMAHPLSLELANGIPEVGTAYLLLTAGIGCYDFGGDVLRTDRRPGNRPDQEAGAGLSDNANNYLASFEAINRNLQDLTAQQEIVAALRQLKPALSGIQVAMPDRNHVKVSLQRGEQSHVFDLSQESEGFRRFLAHLIALHQMPPKAVVIFEEPEKGLYPGALSVLAEQIRAYAVNERGQVILTTHSPLLLSHFRPEEIRVVAIDNLETRIGPISQPQMESLQEHLATTDELLTVNPAQLD